MSDGKGVESQEYKREYQRRAYIETRIKSLQQQTADLARYVQATDKHVATELNYISVNVLRDCLEVAKANTAITLNVLKLIDEQPAPDIKQE